MKKLFGLFMFLSLFAAVSCGGGSSTSDTPTTPPTAPSITNSTSTATTVSLAWNAVDQASSYVIQCKESTDTVYPQGTETTATSFKITNLSAATLHNIRVAAKNSAGLSDYSELNISTDALLVAPTVTVGTATDTTIALSWTSVSSATGYNVYCATEIGSIGAKQNTSPVTSLAYTVTGLSQGTTYFFYVYAIDSEGAEGVNSVGKSGTTTGSTSSLSAPVLTAGTTTSSTAYLSWTAVTGATGYYIYGSESQNGTYLQINADAITVIYQTITGLAPSTTYYFKVIAVDNSLNQSNDSNIVSVTTQAGSSSLSAPTLTAGSTTMSTMYLSWNSVTDATGYNIYGATTQDGVYSLVNADPVTVNYQTITGLLPSTTYYFKVTAVDGSGNVSAYSNIVNATTASPNASLAYVSFCNESEATQYFYGVKLGDAQCTNLFGQTSTEYLQTVPGVYSPTFAASDYLFDHVMSSSYTLAASKAYTLYVYYDGTNTYWQLDNDTDGTTVSGSSPKAPSAFSTLKAGKNSAKDIKSAGYKPFSFVKNKTSGAKIR